MNETNHTETTSLSPKQTIGTIASGWLGIIASPAVATLSFFLIAGLALSGMGLMGISAITWLLSGADWFCGIGLLTGGVFLASATVLCLGQLSRAGDALYRKAYRNKKLQTT